MSGNVICNLLGTRYPLIQGGMARVGTGGFAAAVSNAGALGTIGSGSMEPVHLEENLAECQTALQKGKPYAVNLMLMNPHCEELVEIICRHHVPVVTTGAGSPAPYVERLHEAGCTVIPVVASPQQAKRLERLGVDAFIGEGCEAGGHIGELTTMALIPQLVDAVSCPVIAAGGIASGRQLLAALALGASGVQVGSLFLAAEECPIHPNYQNMVLKAKPENVTVIGRIGGTPTRVLKNAMSRAYLQKEKAGADWETLERFSLGGLRIATVEGDEKNGAFMVGQSVGLIKERKPLTTLIEALFQGANDAWQATGTVWEEIEDGISQS